MCAATGAPYVECGSDLLGRRRLRPEGRGELSGPELGVHLVHDEAAPQEALERVPGGLLVQGPLPEVLEGREVGAVPVERRRVLDGVALEELEVILGHEKLLQVTATTASPKNKLSFCGLKVPQGLEGAISSNREKAAKRERRRGEGGEGEESPDGAPRRGSLRRRSPPWPSRWRG